MATYFQGSFKNGSTSNPGNISPQISMVIFFLHLLPKMMPHSNILNSYFWQNSSTFCTCKKKLPISKSSEIVDEISPDLIWWCLRSSIRKRCNYTKEVIITVIADAPKLFVDDHKYIVDICKSDKIIPHLSLIPRKSE